jgi:hypothetical protein
MTVAKVASPEPLVGYDEDVLVWSQQQARLLREGRFAELDIEHLADEIEDVGKSEKRELSSRCAVLMAHLLKWRFQPSFRSSSWRATILGQRERIEMALDETPSLRNLMRDAKWRRGVWIDAREQAVKEMRLKKDILPSDPPWSIEEARDPDFWPTA